MSTSTSSAMPPNRFPRSKHMAAVLLGLTPHPNPPPQGGRGPDEDPPCLAPSPHRGRGDGMKAPAVWCPPPLGAYWWRFFAGGLPVGETGPCCGGFPQRFGMPTD